MSRAALELLILLSDPTRRVWMVGGRWYCNCRGQIRASAVDELFKAGHLVLDGNRGYKLVQQEMGCRHGSS